MVLVVAERVETCELPAEAMKIIELLAGAFCCVEFDYELVDDKLILKVETALEKAICVAYNQVLPDIEGKTVVDMRPDELLVLRGLLRLMSVESLASFKQQGNTRRRDIERVLNKIRIFIDIANMR